MKSSGEKTQNTHQIIIRNIKIRAEADLGKWVPIS